MKTPFKTVDKALARAGVGIERVSDERAGGDPVFVYLARGFCRDDGAHGISGFTAGDLLRQVRQVRPCGCPDCG